MNAKRIYWKAVPIIAFILLLLTVFWAIVGERLFPIISAGMTGYYVGTLVEHHWKIR